MEEVDLGAVVSGGETITYTATDFTVTLPEAGSYYIVASADTCDTTQTTVGLALALDGTQLPSAT
ncbi:MAG: hypothetical protein IKM39_04155, partial [Clostridia bacterium]|nr:hypothetical protein [Clostridia bacterium]